MVTDYEIPLIVLQIGIDIHRNIEGLKRIQDQVVVRNPLLCAAHREPGPLGLQCCWRQHSEKGGQAQGGSQR